jgi:HEAT repeat protein
MLRQLLALTALCLAFALPGFAAEPDKEKTEKPNNTKSIDRLMKEAKSADPAVRDGAIRGLAGYGSEAKVSIPLLITSIKDPDPGVIASALAALQAICSDKDIKELKKEVSALTNVLQFGIPSAKLNAAMLLGRLGVDAKAAVRPLIDNTIRSTSWEVRKAGAYALGHCAVDKKNGPEQSVVNSLTRLIYNDDCAQVRLQALQSIAQLGAHRTEAESQSHVVKHALEYTIRKNRDVSEMVWAHTLLTQTVSVKPEAHMGSVSVMITAKDPAIRMQAAQALGAMLSVPKDALLKDVSRPVVDRLFETLVETLRDRDDNVAGAAAAALATARENLGKKYEAAIVAIATDAKEEAHSRLHATHTLGLLGDKSIKLVTVLIDLLSDKDPEVSGAATQSLAHLGRQKDVLKKPEYAAIIALLENRKAAPLARGRAASTIGLIGENAVDYIPNLIAALADPEHIVGSNAAQAVAAMMPYLTDKPHMAAIVALLTHNNPDVRARIAQLLGVFDNRADAYIPDLIKALEDKDPKVVGSAVLSLAQVGQSLRYFDSVYAAVKPIQDHSDKNVQLAAAQAMSILNKFRQQTIRPEK